MRKIRDKRGLFALENNVNYDQVFIATNDAKYTFRGLHYQTNPYQVKRVNVIQGKVLDFLYNINTGEVIEYILTPSSETLTIGEEYAHGYLTLEPNTILYYGVEGKFNPETYSSIVWNTIPQIKDKIVKIIGANYFNKLIISDKDKYGK